MPTNKTPTAERFLRTQHTWPLRALGHGAAVDALHFEVEHFEVLLNDPTAPVQVQAVTPEGDVANWCGDEWDFM